MRTHRTSDQSVPAPPQAPVERSGARDDHPAGAQTATGVAMRTLGLDLGERRIGVALSDPLGLTAQRLTVIERRDAPADLARIRALVATHQVAVIVVGLPLTLRGRAGPQAQKARAFVAALQRHLRTPVKLVDERLTTVQGQRALAETGTSSRKRRALIDQVAAQLILQHFLDHARQQQAGSTHDVDLSK